MSIKAVRVAIYVRISDDREGLGLGVERQLSACREVCEQRGWTAAEFEDNDISATYGEFRPRYETLMARVDAGELDVIVVYHQSRLWRNRLERANGIERMKSARVRVIAARGPEVDMATAYGRYTAGVMGEGDTLESEIKAERIRDKVLELAAAGKIANGGPRPFGYTRVYDIGSPEAAEGRRRRIIRDEINEAEAETVRECAQRILSGDSLRAIVADLNKRGIRTSTGRLWTISSLRTMIRSGRIAGLREHRRQVVGKAVWPAIIDVETHRQIRARLDTNERPPGSRVRIHYLTGFVYCSTCDLKMRPKPAHNKLVYCCPPRAEGGCGGRVIGLAKLQRMVDIYMAGDAELGVVGRLCDPKLLRELAERESTGDSEAKKLLDLIEADERRLEVLQNSLTDGDEDELPDVLAAARTIRRRIADSREQLGRLVEIPAALRESLPDLAARWPDLHIDRKQALLRLFVQKIVIAPAVRGRNWFDPERVDIIPRRWG